MKITCFRFNKISNTSSRIPAIVENSCLIPIIFTPIIAIPDKSDKRTRRNALPIVIPCPFVTGKTKNLP